jgi:hypothetical protein
MDFLPDAIALARHRQSRDDGDSWYCACCKAWVNGTDSYAVAIMPMICGGHGNADNCVIVCPSCREWLRENRRNDPYKVLKVGDIPYKAYARAYKHRAKG